MGIPEAGAPALLLPLNRSPCASDPAGSAAPGLGLWQSWHLRPQWSWEPWGGGVASLAPDPTLNPLLPGAPRDGVAEQGQAGLGWIRPAVYWALSLRLLLRGLP